MSHTTTQKAAPAPVPTGASAWEWEKGWCQEPDLNWRPSHFQCVPMRFIAVRTRSHMFTNHIPAGYTIRIRSSMSAHVHPRSTTHESLPIYQTTGDVR